MIDREFRGIREEIICDGFSNKFSGIVIDCAGIPGGVLDEPLAIDKYFVPRVIGIGVGT